MKVVIDIPDERYKKFTEYDGFMCYAEQLIKNGTPLPKGHGRLIDADVLKARAKNDITGYDYEDLIDTNPAIIEADKESN